MRQASTTRGFSIIELTLTVGLILTISAISVPNLIQAKMRANEARAVTTMRAVINAQAMYALQHPEIGFAPDMKSLVVACGLENGAACGPYVLKITPNTQHGINVGYTLIATPLPGSGGHFLCTDETGVLRYSDDPQELCRPTLPAMGNPMERDISLTHWR